MCNGLHYDFNGFESYEPANPEAAKRIAELVSEKSSTPVCPLIEHCYGRCMSLMNARQWTYATQKYDKHHGSNPRECEVFITCDDTNHFAGERVIVPQGLLKEDNEVKG